MLKNLKSFNPAEIEEKILKFWQENKIFEKSVSKKAPKGDYVFYDGPPFATGLPHYGQILAGTIKDVIPRYQTMKGKKVERRWGWDCHGLPVEFEVEKKLGLKTKKDIEKFGIEKFNQIAKESVLKYETDWKKIIPRVGRWADMENAYKTMDVDYMESVLWVFKSLYEKGLIYEGYKSMHICPRCETTLSNFEVAEGYKDIEDSSVIVEFELEDKKNTYILAWTTTPWTLPGNVALAINPNVKYVEVKGRVAGNTYILAQPRVESVFGKEHKIIRNIDAHDLIGKKYKPLFPYYAENEKLQNRANGWKIYGANFVSLDEGTSVVHIAPAFGADDMTLGQKYKLPFIQHVSMDGCFKKEVKDFARELVKPKGDHQSTDNKIIKFLDKQGKLFKSEKITHSYPHCWRCETPLLNYAASSWFVKVTAIKNKLIKNNKKIHWVPLHIKTGRFGQWLKEARDWAISRSRFWGSPLPVWKCQKCEKLRVIGSINELKAHSKNKITKIILLRHAESTKNVAGIYDSSLGRFPLTKKGEFDAQRLAKLLKKEKIDLIFSSPIKRTKQTAEIIGKKLGLKLNFSPDLMDINNGIWEGKTKNDPRIADSRKKYKCLSMEKQYITPRGETGESWQSLEKRITKFTKEVVSKYPGRNILLVTHQGPIIYLLRALRNLGLKETVDLFEKEEFREYLRPIPIYVDNSRKRELDLHRPYIDKIEFPCPCGGLMKRIPDVFDCWFESGSMPYGQAHYPFSGRFSFPAEFIAEGIDQTRGWFYTLLVLSTALFNKSAYKNVIVNGIILAEDGQKMSKRLKNYPDPMELVEKYGADALRLYLLSSPAVAAENLNFSEKGVDEIYKKVVLRLWNVYKFYEMYADKPKTINYKLKTKNVLDRWILARLEQLKTQVSNLMDKYELDRAVRPLADFVDDLSTWYIRRSRERFKNEGQDKQNAILMTKFVLEEFSKIIAPFMPFIAEGIYKSLQSKDSVHLETWPELNRKLINKNLLDSMAEVRKIASLALEARAKAGIKVRQPLASLTIKRQVTSNKYNKELLDILKDEINVKEIIFDPKIKDEVEFDTKITPELKAEGQLRELVRIIQDLRKETGYTPKDKIYLWLEMPKEIESAVNKYLKDFKEKIGAENIEFRRTDKFDAEIETKIDDQKTWLGIKKI
jgi:isoleucyl-tRNA synthetase